MSNNKRDQIHRFAGQDCTFEFEKKFDQSPNKIFQFRLRSHYESQLSWFLGNFGLFFLFVFAVVALFAVLWHKGLQSHVHFIVWFLLVVFCLVYLTIKLRSQHAMVHSETITAIEGHGIQITTSCYRFWPWMQEPVITERALIDLNRIQSLFMNEGFHVNKVIYYMAMLVKDEERLILPFKELFPRMHLAIFIYQCCRHVLYGEPEPSFEKLLETLSNTPSRNIVA